MAKVWRKKGKASMETTPRMSDVPTRGLPAEAGLVLTAVNSAAALSVHTSCKRTRHQVTLQPRTGVFMYRVDFGWTASSPIIISQGLDLCSRETGHCYSVYLANVFALESIKMP